MLRLRIATAPAVFGSTPSRPRTSTIPASVTPRPAGVKGTVLSSEATSATMIAPAGETGAPTAAAVR